MEIDWSVYDYAYQSFRQSVNLRMCLLKDSMVLSFCVWWTSCECWISILQLGECWDTFIRVFLLLGVVLYTYIVLYTIPYGIVDYIYIMLYRENYTLLWLLQTRTLFSSLFSSYLSPLFFFFFILSAGF